MKLPFPHLWTDKCADLLRAFNDHGVEYLLIGSMAQTLHRPERAGVNDMDLMINSTPENAGKVLSALRAVPGAGDLQAIKTGQLAKEGVQMTVLPGQGDVDVLTPPKEGFSFCDAAARSTSQCLPDPYSDIPVRVAAMCDLEMLDSLRKRAPG